MAVTLERKLEVARRSYRILTEDYGLPPEDIWWDTLVFPCGTGDRDYLGAAQLTIDGIPLLKAEFPGTKTLLGVSNVSFGLPISGREVLNAVFLYRATRAGLDAAIVNTQRLARYAEIPEEERELAESLLDLQPGDIDAGERAVARFTEHFRGRKAAQTTEDRSNLDVAERLARSIVEGDKTGIEQDLTEALEDERWPAAPRHRQRALDGRNGRGRPPLQRQPADRRRGTAERRGHESGRLPPRALHGGPIG